jgi:peptidyl-prolyl cis-trans isomerase D
MLKLLRGRKRLRNIVLIIFIGLLTLSLVALFSAGGSGGKFFGGTAGSDTVIARVGSYDVTVKEFKDRLSDFGQQIAQGQGRSKKDDLGMLFDTYGPQVLDALIREKVILYDADRLNLGSSDNEVQNRLKQIFSPWQGFEQYRLRVEQAGMTPVRFEENLRANIAQEHLRSYITAGVGVDPKEVEQDFRGKNTTSTVRWVELDPQKLRDKVQTSAPDLRAYFDAHKDDFKITTEQRRARYIFVDSNQAGASIQVPDDELKRDFNPEVFVKRVRVSQIVLNVPKDEPANTKDKAAGTTPTTPVISEEDIRAKAQGISQRAQGSEGTPAEDFAKLAREFSEDASTKSKGGDLGWLNKGDKRDATDPLSRVFAMKKDETSQPIKKGDSYYVFKITDRETPAFAAAREDLLKAARLRKGYSRAVEIATEAEQQFKETRNAETVVAAINKKYDTQLSSVKETPFFSEGEPLADLGAASEFESSLFELQNPGDTGKQIPVDKGFAIAQYVEKRDPHEPAFEEVNAKVEQAYRTEKAKELAVDRAKELAKTQNIDELKKMTASMGLKLDERIGLTGSDSIGPLVTETSRAIVYKLKVGEVTKEPIKGDNDVYVIAAIENRKEADMGSPFQKERKSIEQRLLDDKRNSFFSTYLAMTQKQLKDEGKIKIYDDAVAAAVQSSGAPAQQAGQSRMPTRSSGSPRRSGRGALGAPLTAPGKR